MFDVAAISLDLDDTLWPVKPLIARAEAKMLSYLEAHYPRVSTLLAAGDAPEIRRQVVRANPAKRHDLTFLRKAVLSELAKAANYDQSLVEPAFASFDVARNQVKFFAGALDTLALLSARYPVIGCSNGNAALDKVGIAQFFFAHVSARDAGAAKPDRAIFEQVSKTAGIPAERILHIGDDPEADVEGARRAGMQALWINSDGESWPLATDAPLSIAAFADLRNASMLEL